MNYKVWLWCNVPCLLLDMAKNRHKALVGLQSKVQSAFKLAISDFKRALNLKSL